MHSENDPSDEPRQQENRIEVEFLFGVPDGI